jgi:hypothetical protein
VPPHQSVVHHLCAVSFFRLMGLFELNHSKLNLCPSVRPTLTCTHPLARIAPACFQQHLPLLDSGNLVMDRDSNMCCMWLFCTLARIIRQSFLQCCVCGLLYIFFIFLLYFLFFFSPLYFAVLACYVEDVNNFLACELRRMSFGKSILLPMYRIESIWSKPVVTTED